MSDTWKTFHVKGFTYYLPRNVDTEEQKRRVLQRRYLSLGQDRWMRQIEGPELSEEEQLEYAMLKEFLFPEMKGEL